jgi:hypothetical protein
MPALAVGHGADDGGKADAAATGAARSICPRLVEITDLWVTAQR